MDDLLKSGFATLCLSLCLCMNSHADITESNAAVYINTPESIKYRYDATNDIVYYDSQQAACAVGEHEYTVNNYYIVQENARAVEDSCLSDSGCDCLYEVTYYNANGDVTDYYPEQFGQNAVGKYIFCPDGYIYNSTIQQCQKGFTKGFYLNATPIGKTCDSAKDGNPCEAATGNKYQVETDYASPIPGDIYFKRYYNSLGSAHTATHAAMNWRHTYSRTIGEAPIERREESQLLYMTNNLSAANQTSLYSTEADACTSGWNEIKGIAFGGQFSSATATVQGDHCKIVSSGQTQFYFTLHSNHPTTFASTSSISYIDLLAQSNLMTVTRSNGGQLYFEKNGTAWQAVSDQTVQLEQLATGWRLTDADDTVEMYDATGKLITITSQEGQIQTLDYTLPSANGGDDNPATLDRVTGPYGRELYFAYNSSGFLQSVTTPDGLITYSNDQNGNLASVTYPDNTTRFYVYDKANQYHHLTGIIDEKGNRFATWDYDTQGRAILSKHALNTEAVTFTYNTDGTTTINDPLGGSHTYTFETVQGKPRVTNVTGDACLTCTNSQIKSRTYDANGYLQSTLDLAGNLTNYSYNTRGLQDERTEAVGTNEERRIVTQWHADYREPTQIDVYDKNNTLIKRTINSYDTQGRLENSTSESY